MKHKSSNLTNQVRFNVKLIKINKNYYIDDNKR